MELTNKKHNDIWTTHDRDTSQPDEKNGNLHVQEYQSNDEPWMERGQMVPGEKTAV